MPARLATTAFGRTGLDVSRIGFGAMELRGPQSDEGRVIERSQATKLLHAVLDSGINFIDTSPDYGESEELIGKALGSRRDELILASKCGCPTGSPAQRTMGVSSHSYTRQNIRAGVEGSLQRLRTDRLDLVQIHLSPAREQLERDDTVSELRALQQEGKVRFIGMSGNLPHLADHIAMRCFDAFQVPYSAMAPEHDELIARAAGTGAGVIIRGSVWRGIPFFQRRPVDRAVEALRSMLGRPNRWQSTGLDDLLGDMSIREFLLRFTLSHPSQCTTIVGTASIEHLGANVDAARKGPLPADLYNEAKRRITLKAS